MLTKEERKEMRDRANDPASYGLHEELAQALDALDEAERIATARVQAVDLHDGDALVFKVIGLDRALMTGNGRELVAKFRDQAQEIVERAGLVGVKVMVVDRETDLAVLRKIDG